MSESHIDNKTMETIEEIGSDTHSKLLEEKVEYDPDNPKSCIKCGNNTVIKLLGCHTRCETCGNETDCSDSGV